MKLSEKDDQNNPKKKYALIMYTQYALHIASIDEKISTKLPLILPSLPMLSSEIK